MTAIARLAATVGVIWTRLFPHSIAAETMAFGGPNLRKEAGLAPGT